MLHPIRAVEWIRPLFRFAPPRSGRACVRAYKHDPRHRHRSRALANARGARKRHGERFLPCASLAAKTGRGLAPLSRPGALSPSASPPRKPFGKALGTASPCRPRMHAVAVGHDARGASPKYRYDERPPRNVGQQALRAHLSISDEDEHIVAFALIESAEPRSPGT